ncbi:pentatricopeptide repeat-containing protein At5g47360-like [Papaver somniferum]|uniref:pentatricopeptide repeat-containing protein At5g47360-like n=1 Tax=Papaver somniferum TaxID=3469 RepID=UPI000E702CF9|nr:pentatricopeptide repeat-containing protein At5g47360-like [Papaver somniferum]
MEEAVKLFKQMLASEIKPGGLASISFIKQLCLQEQFLRHWSDTLRCKRNIYSTHVDPDIYSILLIDLSQEGHLVEAANVVSVMVENRIQLKSPYLDNIDVLLSRIGEKVLARRLMSLK